MTPISIYDTRTGEIVSTGGILLLPEFREEQIRAALVPWVHLQDTGDGTFVESHALVEEDANPAMQYVQVLDSVAAVVDKPELVIEIDRTEIVADGEDFVTLTGLPDPCEIIIDDPDPTVETTMTQVFGGGFEFAAATPGVYTIEVRRFPFLAWKAEITAA